MNCRTVQHMNFREVNQYVKLRCSCSNGLYHPYSFLFFVSTVFWRRCSIAKNQSGEQIVRPTFVLFVLFPPNGGSHHEVVPSGKGHLRCKRGLLKQNGPSTARTYNYLSVIIRLIRLILARLWRACSIADTLTRCPTNFRSIRVIPA